MLAHAPVVGFVPVSDTAAAERFYAGLLGLHVVDRSPFAVVVASANGAKIRCALTSGASAQPFTILGWEVVDIHASVKELRNRKIEPIVYPHFKQDEDGVWTAPSAALVVWFHDPDGNVLSLSQHEAAGAAKQ